MPYPSLSVFVGTDFPPPAPPLTLVLWPTATLPKTSRAQRTVRGPMCSPSSRADQRRVRTGWESWTCPTRATPPSASPLYQTKNPKNMLTTDTYAKHAHAAAPAPASPPAGPEDRPAHERREEGGEDDERPGDHAPAADLLGQSAALRVAQGAQHHGEQHQQVPPIRHQPRPLRGREQQDREEPECARPPERPRGPLAGPQHGHHGRRRRKQADDHRRVRRRKLPQGQRREQREAHDNPRAHHHQPTPVPPLRQPLARNEKQGRGQRRRHQRPPEPHERGVEVRHRHAGQRNREAEGQYPQEPEQEAPRPQGLRFRRRFGNVTLNIHEQR